MEKLRFWSMVCLAGILGVACGDKERNDDVSKGSDTASVADSGVLDPLGKAGEEYECLGSISGRILKNGLEGMVAEMAVCIGDQLCFNPLASQSDGNFVWEYPREADMPCVRHDFQENWLHIDIYASANRHQFASYAFVRQPTQKDISDKGENDFDLDVGTLFLYELPTETASYTTAAGASISLLGLGFEMAPGVLVKRTLSDETDRPVDHDQTIRVFKAPLDSWHPPFIHMLPDVLYYISPHWAKLAGPGVVLSIVPPAGWSDGDTGTLHLLGGYVSLYESDEGVLKSSLLFRDADGGCINTYEWDLYEGLYDGVLHECGTAQMVNGVITTSPVPRFTWVALFMN